MAEAKRDGNRVPTLLAVSNADGITPVTLYADPSTHRLLVDLPTGSGDVVGPASAVDGNLVAFDGTTGKIIKDSGAKVSDFLTSVTPHNILSATHSDTLADTVVRGDILIGNATPKWARLAFPATPTGKVLQATATDVAWSASALGTAAFTASTSYATSAQGTTADNAVPKSLYDANSILYATTDNTPVALSVSTNAVIGRINGDIVNVPIDSDLSSTSAGDDTVPSAKATKAMGDLKLPLAGGTMTGDLTIGDAKQIVLTAPSADVTCTGISTSAFNSGYSSSAVGDLVYLDSSATWQKADADAIATSGGMLGIALEVKASGNALRVALPGSFVRVNSWNWTPGTTLYVSETAGGIATAIPTGADGVVRVIGWATNADYIYFYPSPGNSTVVA